MTQNPINIHEALRWASSFLEGHNREQRVGEILLMHHLNLSKSQLLISLRNPITEEKLQAFKADVKAHATTGIPVQHLTGTETFYGREFFVNKDVLIPRPETEELVVGVIEHLNLFSMPATVIDIGTGSGIIAITLKLEKPDLVVWASDLSEQALTTAKKNASNLQADVGFYQGDFLQPLIDNDKQVDIIVSNPPYIPFTDKNTLADTVKNYDPALALFAESNGLAAYQRIVVQAKKVLKTPGLLAFEIGYQQGKQVHDLIKHHFPSSHVEVRKDINGKDRMVFAVVD